jgi:hypothetical protein
MKDESEKKTKALAEAVGKHAETLRSLLRRNAAARDQNAIRCILEAHEGYIKAYEGELIQREITRRRLRIR